MEREVRYARNGDVSIAHQVVGDGPIDHDLVAGSGIEFSDAGAHEPKGVPGTWQLFRAIS